MGQSNEYWYGVSWRRGLWAVMRFERKRILKTGEVMGYRGTREDAVAVAVKLNKVRKSGDRTEEEAILAGMRD